MTAAKKTRIAFTLVELLVVMSLIAILATLMIGFFPSAVASAREARAAQSLQGWLNIAKQRAVRDQAPRGLRLWIPSGSMQVVECQYLEQPEDFSGGAIQSGLPIPPPPPASGYTMQNTIQMSVDVTNGYGVTMLSNDPNAKYWNVQVGDYLEVLGTGLMHQIVQIGVPNGANPPVIQSNFLVISPPLTIPITSATQNYRIVRSARPIGDETLKLPSSTVVDLAPNFDAVTFPGFTNPLPMATFTVVDTTVNPPVTTQVPIAVDILFGPSGAVISREVATPNLHLWVRAPDQNQPNNYFRGEPTIVSVFVRTGFVGAYNANPNSPDPWAHVQR
jgi:prepilin-type N-terminal cleavage/methylation domain-containing protein